LDIGAGIECDVRLSSDGEVMIFHDHDLRRMCASALAVESTRADVLAGQKLFDSGQHIPRLAELLALVAGRVPILIEVKCRGGNATQISWAVAEMVRHYAGPIGVMSFEPAVGKWLARNMPQIWRGLVISERASLIDRWRCIRASRPEFLAVDLGAIARPWVARERGRRWIYSWTIRSAADRQTAEIHADAPIWEGDGRPRS
jgi:glycerophosphoryl diester phosphodiesterase